MKKISILLACILTGVAMVAQTRVVKNAETAMKKGDSYANVVKLITPAFDNPETSQLPLTYYIPGKAGFNTYRSMMKLEQAGHLPKDGAKVRSEALLGGYRYLTKAMHLDSVPDAKGRVKPKYSKEAVNIIGSHLPDFSNIALDFWNAKNWDKAYEAWDIYCHVATDPSYLKAIGTVPNDTAVGEIMYNRGLAAYHGGNMEKALNSFLEARIMGYQSKDLYDYAIFAADKMGDTERVVELSEAAMPLYGGSDPRYVRQLINYYMAQKDFENALSMVDVALDSEPDNAQLHVLRGVLYEQLSRVADSQAEYERAVELDPQNAEALYNLGRLVYNQGVTYNDEAPSNPQEYARVKAERILPTFKQAIAYLEKAYDLNPANKDILNLLETAYYLVDDDINLKFTQERQKR